VRKFGRGVATMSTVVRRLERKMLQSDDLRHVVIKIETELLILIYSAVKKYPRYSMMGSRAAG